MCLRNFSFDFNPPLKTVQIMVFEVLTLHEIIELLPSDESYELYLGNNDPTKGIPIVLVGLIFINKLV